MIAVRASLRGASSSMSLSDIFAPLSVDSNPDCSLRAGPYNFEDLRQHLW